MPVDINLIFVLVVVAVSVSLAVIYMQQQRLQKERKLHRDKLIKLEADFNQYVQDLKAIHTQELEQIKSLYPVATKNDGMAGEDKRQEIQEVSSQQAQAVTQLADASKQAKQIIAEARAEAKKIMLQQEAETQKSIVKVVIQVVRKVVGKSLNYEDHKKIIMDALKEL